MRITNQQKRALTYGAVGGGVLLAAQMWRRRNPYDFAGKSVVITGGSRGLGLVLARELADQGARLTLVARDEEELQRAMEDIQTGQPFAEVLPAPADVRIRSGGESAVPSDAGAPPGAGRQGGLFLAQIALADELGGRC